MSFEETLVCDGCSVVVSGGPRGETVPELLALGGAAFAIEDRRRNIYVRVFGADAPAMSSRHLCWECSDAAAAGCCIPPVTRCRV